MFKCENYNAQKPAECIEYVSSSHAMHFEIIKSEVDYSYIPGPILRNFQYCTLDLKKH